MHNFVFDLVKAIKKLFRKFKQYDALHGTGAMSSSQVLIIQVARAIEDIDKKSRGKNLHPKLPAAFFLPPIISLH